MDSLFAKIIFFFSFLLASITSPGYIKIDQNELSFNFKTGEIYPIYYYLNTQNVGPQKARFEISSDQSWVSGYREGTDFVFVELSPQAYINFILEIHPERLADGVNKARVSIKVLDIDLLVSRELVLDEKEVLVTLNKNLASTTLPILSTRPRQGEAEGGPIPSEEQNRGSSISQPGPEGPGGIGTTLTPEPTITLTPTLGLNPSPLFKPVSSTPKPIPAKTVSPTLSPISSPSVDSTLKQIQSIIDSILLFLKKLF